jgi:hypothetical protein
MCPSIPKSSVLIAISAEVIDSAANTTAVTDAPYSIVALSALSPQPMAYLSDL